MSGIPVYYISVKKNGKLYHYKGLKNNKRIWTQQFSCAQLYTAHYIVLRDYQEISEDFPDSTIMETLY